jgi:hypothetical protein
VGQARLDQINHKMHFVMTGERTTEHEAWVKEREAQGGKKGAKKRRSGGFGKRHESKADKKAKKESEATDKAIGKAIIAKKKL